MNQMEFFRLYYKLRFFKSVWQNTEWIPDDDRYRAYWSYLRLKQEIDQL